MLLHHQYLCGFFLLLNHELLLVIYFVFLNVGKGALDPHKLVSVK